MGLKIHGRRPRKPEKVGWKDRRWWSEGGVFSVEISEVMTGRVVTMSEWLEGGGTSHGS